jgi:hypothetical protein
MSEGIHQQILGAQIRDPKQALTFLLAGNAYATFKSEKTGTHFTYHVTAVTGSATATSPVTHFVAVLTRPDHYEYVGCVYKSLTFAHGAKSKIAKDAQSVVAFMWVWRKLRAGSVPDVLSVYHEGRCGRCGRQLTRPESIESGVGPECAKKGAA